MAVTSSFFVFIWFELVSSRFKSEVFGFSNQTQHSTTELSLTSPLSISAIFLTTYQTQDGAVTKVTCLEAVTP